jgi:GT2 family glycosyltransferase
MGDRPGELAQAAASVRAQVGHNVELVLVINGGEPDRSLADTLVEPGDNLGIPGGRNAGAKTASGEFILFLDDDGRLEGIDVFEVALRRFNNEPDLAAIALRIVDETGVTARRHLPGLRHKPDQGRDVTAFPGGGVIIRAAEFAGVGGLCERFTYALEETDLAWRLIDRGHRIAYDPYLRMVHPKTLPSRHADFARLTARNRIWLAHRNLPLPLAILYPLNWLLVSNVRNRFKGPFISASVSGSVAGLRELTGPRSPMRWKTVWRLTRLGRPPVV